MHLFLPHVFGPADKISCAEREKRRCYRGYRNCTKADHPVLFSGGGGAIKVAASRDMKILKYN